MASPVCYLPAIRPPSDRPSDPIGVTPTASDGSGDLILEALEWGEAGGLHLLALVTSVAGLVRASPADRATIGMGIVTEVLLGGLMIAGDVDVEFHQWDGTPADWIARIHSTLASVDPSALYPGFGGWLANTAAGRDVLEARRPR